jgi:hypothetical protein
LRAHEGALVACHGVEEDRLPPPAPLVPPVIAGHRIATV